MRFGPSTTQHLSRHMLMLPSSDIRQLMLAHGPAPLSCPLNAHACHRGADRLDVVLIILGLIGSAVNGERFYPLLRTVSLTTPYLCLRHPKRDSTTSLSAVQALQCRRSLLCSATYSTNSACIRYLLLTLPSSSPDPARTTCSSEPHFSAFQLA